jgi:FkbM family methyltransferase
MKFKLPNGLLVSQINKYETDFVYKEVFEDKVYLKNGISLPEAPIVFDVGANVGLFTLFVKSMRPSASIYAFEPSVELYDVLRLNAADDPTIHLYQCGISNLEKVVDFTYYPHYTILSGFHPDLDQDEAQLKAGITKRLQSTRLGKNLTNNPRAMDYLVGDKLTEARTYKCEIRSLSSVMRDENIPRIDLLKIDAERSEMDILNGIKDADWPKIWQIVLEIHDLQGRLTQQITESLTVRGFTAKCEEEMDFGDSHILNLYAIRSASEQGG